MDGPNPTIRRRPRFTIGSLMIAICVVALVLGIARPLSRILLPLYPELSRLIERLATIEMGFVLCGVLITCFAVARLMAEDERS